MMSSPMSPNAIRAPKIPEFFFESTPPAPEATARSPLFGLPLEVRDKIYDYLWADAAPIKQYDQDCNFTLIYPGSAADRRNGLNPRWIRTSKVVLAEAIWQFYRKVRCTAWEASSSAPGYALSAYRLLTLCRVRHYEESRIIPIESIIQRKADGKFFTIRTQKYFKGVYDDFHIVSWAEVEFVARYIPVDKFGDPPSWMAIVPDYAGEAIISTCLDHPYSTIASLVDHLRQKSHVMSSLALKFSTPDYPGMGWDDPDDENSMNINDRKAFVDFAYLEMFGTSLESVNFGLQIYHWKNNRWQHAMFMEIQEELERVAKHLVGATDGHSWSLKDWITDLEQDEKEQTHRGQKDEGRFIEQEKPGWYGTWHLEVRRIAGPQSKGTAQYKGFNPPPQIFTKWQGDDDDGPWG